MSSLGRQLADVGLTRSTVLNTQYWVSNAQYSLRAARHRCQAAMRPVSQAKLRFATSTRRGATSRHAPSGTNSATLPVPRGATTSALSWAHLGGRQSQQDVGIPGAVESQRFVDVEVTCSDIDHCGVHAEEFPR